jgi:hypothetical protein
MILNTQRNKSPRLAATSFALVTSVAAFFAITVICSAPRFVLAQNEPAPATAGSPIEGVPVGAAGGGTPAVELAIPLPTPEAPESRFSPIPGAPPKPAAIAPGPKFKPGLSEAITAQPSEPKPPRTPRPPRSRPDSSLEERLERLERMVETLMARQGTSRDLRALKQSAEIDRKGIAKIDAFPKRHADVAGKQVIEPDEIEKIKEQAKHEAARAAAQAKRAAVQAEKAAKFEQTQQTTPEFKDGQKTQLEALRKQLEMLERERKKLDRQIERLQRDQEKLNEQLEKDQSSDAQSNLFKTAPSFENKAARR